MCQLKSETRFASSWYGGGEIVELDVVMDVRWMTDDMDIRWMTDDLDIRWTTDDQKNYDIVLSYPSLKTSE